MVPPVDPVLVRIGPVAIYWYGVLIVTGVLLGAFYAARQAPRKGIEPDHIWNGLVVCVILGIIGARLYHVFSSPRGGGLGWSYYREHPIDIINFWDHGFQGLGIYGAIIGGALGVAAYALYHKISILTLLDLGAPGLALGQAVGRWANFINQELYGPPTGSSWWGVRIDAAHRLASYPISQYPEEILFHPTFLYESLWSLALFITLALLARKLEDRILAGDIFAGYVIGYSVGRFWIEHFFRPDAWMIGPLAAAQWVGLALIACGVVLVVLRHRRASKKRIASETVES